MISAWPSSMPTLKPISAPTQRRPVRERHRAGEAEPVQEAEPRTRSAAVARDVERRAPAAPRRRRSTPRSAVRRSRTGDVDHADDAPAPSVRLCASVNTVASSSTSRSVRARRAAGCIEEEDVVPADARCAPALRATKRAKPGLSALITPWSGVEDDTSPVVAAELIVARRSGIGSVVDDLERALAPAGTAVSSHKRGVRRHRLCASGRARCAARSAHDSPVDRHAHRAGHDTPTARLRSRRRRATSSSVSRPST